MRLIKFIILALGLIQLTGCVTNLHASAVSEINQSEFQKIYVKHFTPDKRNLNYIIADELTRLGYPASPLDEGEKVPEGADVVITYVDNWQWDITNYMIKIKIDVRNASDKQLIVSGESLRTSLARKEPKFMIRETLEKILQEVKLKYHHT